MTQSEFANYLEKKCAQYSRMSQRKISRWESNPRMFELREMAIWITKQFGVEKPVRLQDLTKVK